MAIVEVQVGDTVKFTFVNSGATLASGLCSILDGEETVVNTGTPISSGDGHYYHYASVATPGWYVQKWSGTINGNAVHRRAKFLARIE